MKKIYLAMLMAAVAGSAANAQESEGGLPWSISLQSNVFTGQVVDRIILAEPDYASYHIQDEQDAIEGAKPYRVSAMVGADVDINKNGTWTFLEDGSKVWRAQISIPGAQALDFYYDNFALPQGVKYYVSNENGKQILGAYTNVNTNQFKTFTNEEVQGNTAYLEINIPSTVNVSDIAFHINKIGAGYRSYDFLTKLYGNEAEANNVLRPTVDASSPCHVNANCSEGDLYAAWAKSKSATIQINMGGSVCSGTLLNHPGNTPGGDCSNLFLTASHCDGENGRTDDHFAEWKFRFNYQYTECEGTTLESYKISTGATFKARSKFPSMTTPANAAVADFLLLQLNSVPASADAYFAGWNRNADLSDEDDYPYFVGFHHPAGDPKKLARATYVDGSGRFNQTSINGTHWATVFAIGGTEGGSSGSGLFDTEGYLVGDLSGGQNPTGSCAPLGKAALYSKLSYTWENEYDQTEFPGVGSRMKDFLDPGNTGVTKWGPSKYDCIDAYTSLKDIERMLDASVMVYPNPVSGSVVNMKVNFEKATPLQIEVYNIVGIKQSIYKTANVMSGVIDLDVSGLPNGVYLLKIGTQDAQIAKKITIAR